jgi:general secretion pathway protein G
MNDMRRDGRRSGSSGFTLVEVLLVVAILGILAGIVAVRFGGQGESARIKATRSSIANICTAIDIYEVDVGKYPASLQSLVTSDGSMNWRGPYLRGGVPMDPWGTAFEYSLQGETGYKITSAGPDASIGSSDDITSFDM